MNGRAETLKAVLDDEEEEGGERAVRRRWWVWRREFCGWRGGLVVGVLVEVGRGTEGSK